MYKRKDEGIVLDQEVQNHNKSVGMRKAELSAGRKWQDRAIKIVRGYPDNGKEFKMEDVREYAENKTNLDNPPNNWSYGPLAKRCVREGLLIVVGHGPCRNVKSHGVHVDIYIKGV